MAGNKVYTPAIVKKHAYTSGVTIYLDHDGTSEEAKMGSTYSFDKKDKVLKIVVPLLQAQDKDLVLEIIRKIHNDGGLILKETKKTTLDTYSEYSRENANQTTLKFFESILDRDDFYALKMSLFIRSEMSRGVPVSAYKNDIRERFGERGSNIANLCTAGYFEKEFIPLYNAVTKEEFFEYYEIAVAKKARALFVHRGMGQDEMEDEFQKILERALRYHIKEFRIHGLGVQNVATLKQFFSEKEITPEDKFIFKKGEERTSPAFVIEYIITLLNP